MILAIEQFIEPLPDSRRETKLAEVTRSVESQLDGVCHERQDSRGIHPDKNGDFTPHFRAKATTVFAHHLGVSVGSGDRCAPLRQRGGIPRPTPADITRDESDRNGNKECKKRSNEECDQDEWVEVAELEVGRALEKNSRA